MEMKNNRQVNNEDIYKDNNRGTINTVVRQYLDSVGRFTRQHKWLKYPVFFASVLFIIFYKLFFCLFIKLNMNKKVAKFVSVFMVFVLLITNIRLASFAEDVDEANDAENIEVSEFIEDEYSEESYDSYEQDEYSEIVESDNSDNEEKSYENEYPEKNTEEYAEIENADSESEIENNDLSDGSEDSNTVSDNSSLDKAGSDDNTISDNALSEINDNTVSENTISENAISENAVSQNSISDNSISENSLLDNFIEDITSEDVEFCENVVVDGIGIKVVADSGVFPKGARLKASIADSYITDRMESILETKYSKDRNVALAYTFDISILDEDGGEIEPDLSKGSVRVFFSAEEIANSNLETEVYHIKDDSTIAELEASIVSEEEIVVETDGFSYYTVEFTYGNLQYVMEGDSTVNLQEILDYLGLAGKVETASFSNPELVNVYKEANDEWYVSALQSFSTDEKLIIRLDGIDYDVDFINEVEIAVTDPQIYYCTCNYNTGVWTINNVVYSDYSFKTKVHPGDIIVIKAYAISSSNNYYGGLSTQQIEKSEVYNRVENYSSSSPNIQYTFKVDADISIEKSFVRAVTVVQITLDIPVEISGKQYTTLYARSNSNNIYLTRADAFNDVNAYSQVIVPTKAGYTFDGFYTKENGSYKQAVISKVGRCFSDLKSLNVRAYQKWLRNYTLSFSNNGFNFTPPESYTFVEGSFIGGYVSRLPYPTVMGHDFGGWYKEAACINKFDNNNEYINKNMTLYAKCTPAIYTVQFRKDGLRDYFEVKGRYGQKIAKPVNPIREGYTFGGWYKDYTCLNPWDFVNDTINETTSNTPTGRYVVLFAKWDPIYYKVSFDMKGHGSQISDIENIVYDSVITRPESPVVSDYTLVGWYKESSLENEWDFATDKVQKDTTLYAKWEQSAYTVTFDMGGHGVAPDDIAVKESGDKISRPEDPVSEDYSFEGWYKENTFVNEWDFSNDTVSSDITLYAKWKENVYTVTFNTNGFYSPAPAVANIYASVPYVTMPDIQPVEGYDFVAWYKDENCLLEWDFSEDEVTKDITLYAKYKKRQCAVSFENNGIGEKPVTQIVLYKSLVNDPNLSVPGYELEGWYKESTLLNKWDFATDIVTDSNDATKLYANWVRLEYTVTFDVLGHGIELPKITGLYYDAAIPEGIYPADEGYVFKGWYKDSTLKNEWDFATDRVRENTILYAKWEPDASPDPEDPENPEDPEKPDKPDKPDKGGGANGNVDSVLVNKNSNSQSGNSRLENYIDNLQVNIEYRVAETGLSELIYTLNYKDSNGIARPVPYLVRYRDVAGWDSILHHIKELSAYSEELTDDIPVVINMNGSVTVNEIVMKAAADKNLNQIYILDNGVKIGIENINNVISRQMKGNGISSDVRFKILSQTYAQAKLAGKDHCGFTLLEVKMIGMNENAPVVRIESSNTDVAYRRNNTIIIEFDTNEIDLLKPGDEVYLYIGDAKKGLSRYKVANVNEEGKVKYRVPMVTACYTIGIIDLGTEYHK